MLLNWIFCSNKTTPFLSGYLFICWIAEVPNDVSRKPEVFLDSLISPSKATFGIPHWYIGKGKISSAFQHHIFWPSPPKKKATSKVRKTLFPACASTAIWRQLYRENAVGKIKATKFYGNQKPSNKGLSAGASNTASDITESRNDTRLSDVTCEQEQRGRKRKKSAAVDTSTSANKATPANMYAPNARRKRKKPAQANISTPADTSIPAETYAAADSSKLTETSAPAESSKPAETSASADTAANDLFELTNNSFAPAVTSARNKRKKSASNTEQKEKVSADKSGPKLRTRKIMSATTGKSQKKPQDSGDCDWVCSNCGCKWGVKDDPLIDDDWFACVKCRNKFHVTCAEACGIIDEDDGFLCQHCVE